MIVHWISTHDIHINEKINSKVDCLKIFGHSKGLSCQKHENEKVKSSLENGIKICRST